MARINPDWKSKIINEVTLCRKIDEVISFDPPLKWFVSFYYTGTFC